MKKRLCAAVAGMMFLLQAMTAAAGEAWEKAYSILLIGVDRRDDSWNGNSDVMMLATVNFEKQSIILTSFLRDLYADIPGVGECKLNAACANGGAELCVETIESNYGVDIDNYALVDFGSMREIVDALGGVDVEVDEDEREVANDYIAMMCEADGVPAGEHLIEETGLVHLDGYQAVGFSRNRYSGGENDFGRTGRQREIMMALLEKERTAGTGELLKTFLSMLPHMESDIDVQTAVELLPAISEARTFEIKEQHIPYDNEYYVRNEILIPMDMEETIAKIQETIY